MQVGVNYDPMIAKVIARGPDRQSALHKMHTALSELQVRSTSACRHLCCPCSAPVMPLKKRGKA